MELASLYNPEVMTIEATLKNDLNVKEFLESLPIDKEKISLKYCGINPSEGMTNMEKLLLSAFNEMCKPRFQNTLDITVRSKSVRLSTKSVKIVGCKSLKEAEKIFKVLKLEVEDIHEVFVAYRYNMPYKMDYIDIIRKFSASPDFLTYQQGEVCLIKYKKTQFRIRNNKVRQTSKSTEEANIAYNEFMKFVEANN